MNAITKVAEALPAAAVFERGGEALTNSQTVADVFGKRHGDVLASIDALLAHDGNLRHGNSAWFRQIEVGHPTVSGRRDRAFEMTRDGLTILIMGFGGKRALAWKRRFIEAFNLMENELRARSAPAPAFNVKDRGHLRALAMELARELDESQAKVEALEGNVAILQPKARAWEQIADATGCITITGFAKTSGWGPRAVVDFLLGNAGWCFRRVQGGPLIAYQPIVDRGWLVHKLVEFTRRDGSVGRKDEVRLTPAGAAKLAELLELRRRAA